MNFELMVDGEVLPEVSMPILKKAVAGIYDDVGSFIVLEPKTPLEGSIYLQAALTDDNYMVETRLVFGEEFSHYRYTTSDVDEVTDFFVAYYQDNKIPDLKRWDDVTEEF
ncbi:hypothetical protein I2494_15705 [Budviciaceae bacterium BWR-B9]|uniref:Uncharacterized protein n=1 Tax=Limnobaculum allomyrinae TaxID=2791986 RepID=A0ABS1IV49_9GAMM|nr:MULTISPECIES: hypothetical protein [Limnobaculum]MBK5145135.1 hypothetical protein [Limnobaculum allomyrinae]MBV7692966.1 hypothetical protein [Limnobaculum sp. M2-1]